jgi:competence protein ComEA
MMNRLKSWVRVFFGFSRSETNAFLILLPVLFLVVVAMPAYRISQRYHQPDSTSSVAGLDSILAQWQRAMEQVEETGAPALFNPNKASREELASVGIPEKLATRLENYRKAGGRFTIKSDLLKLYGFDSVLYAQLYPYIDLPEKQEKKEKPVSATERKQTRAPFDLNQADSLQLISVYGIGSKLSSRIITYREKLGGFLSYRQLYEIYRLDTAAILELQKRSFIAENFEPKKLFLNTANEKELAAHPYISTNLAKAIVSYRFQHGPFQKVDDLRQIVILNDATFEKIKPYLSLNP